MPDSKHSPFTLRPYQQEAIEAVIAARQRGVRRMVVNLPTGAGKTVIFSTLIQQAQRQVLVLAHREELLWQARDKIQRAAGGDVSVGIEQGEHRASPDDKVVICSIRSLHEGRIGSVLAGRDLGLIVYDECHHATAEDNKRVLRQIGAFEDDWPGTLVGFTATTQRADGAGLDEVFEELVYQRTILDMIEDGYLVPLRGFRVATHASLRQVAGRGMDFDLEQLEEAVDIQERNALVARSILELARDRRTLAFCVTVQHARNLAQALRALGVSAQVVFGDMPRDQRQRALKSFRSGRTQVLTNVGVLTEGFDDPGVSCIAMARPTRSESLYIQCVGRGTRLHPDKEDCLVLDFVDLSDVSLVTLPTLAGMPQDIQLAGEDLREAGQFWHQLCLDHPSFLLEAGEITLEEIQVRAESFDPLTLDVHPEVRAISPHAWISLGASGVGLHVKRAGSLCEVLVLRERRRGRVRYVVYVRGEEMVDFPRLAEAVEAVEYELQSWGEEALLSALPQASWRFEPPDDALRARLRSLKPPRTAGTLHEAYQYLAYAEHAPQWQPRGGWLDTRS